MERLRVGEAGRNGVFACLLAREGFLGPVAPVEGPFGLAALLKLESPEPRHGAFKILTADTKFLLVEYHAQLPIILALEVLDHVAAERIEAIEVKTYRFAHEEIGSGASKWRPTNRKAADHSLPYLLAVSIFEGRFSDAIFAEERYTDPAVLSLIDRITISESPHLSAVAGRSFPCRIEVRLVGGEVRIAERKNRAATILTR